MKLYPVKGIDFENKDVDDNKQNLYFLKLHGEEKYLERKDFYLTDSLSDARLKYCTKKEAEMWASDINEECQEADNDNSRYGVRPDFWSFDVVCFQETH